MTITNLLVPGYAQMLKALSSWLDRAKNQLPEAEAEQVLAARLAPDMLPLSTQIRYVCVQAQEAVFRLTGQEFPASIQTLLAEGQDASAHPGSISEAQSRIRESIEVLGDLGPNALDEAADEPITIELPNGMTFRLSAEQYVRDWSLPQFYFHLMTAYSLLRNNGIEIGKADYVQHMFAYLVSEDE